jgi:zinc D-Ala-D-Ala carboxypeptidase
MEQAMRMPGMQDRITPDFTFGEFLHSGTAVRHGLDNTPSATHLANILGVLAPGMQRIRDELGAPVQITSGYRAPAVNRAVGGSASSQHQLGLAADFVAPRFGSPRAIARHLAEHMEPLRIDQLIFEGTWVHVAFDPAKPRHEALTAHFQAGGGVTYARGIA